MMIKVKPANIFDFYAPTVGASKIADFKGSTSVPNSFGIKPNLSGAQRIEFTTHSSGGGVGPENTSNLGYWIVGGVLVLGTAALIYWYYCEEQKRKQREM